MIGFIYIYTHPYQWLGITESHLNEKNKDSEITISGYDMRRCDRTHKRGGGCIVYFREDLNVLPREDLRDRNLEATWVEVIQKSQRVLIGTVYRAPDDNKFYEHFEEFISRVWSKRKNIIIMGDFNSDLLHKNEQTDLGVQGKKITENIEQTWFEKFDKSTNKN